MLQLFVTDSSTHFSFYLIYIYFFYINTKSSSERKEKGREKNSTKKWKVHTALVSFMKIFYYASGIIIPSTQKQNEFSKWKENKHKEMQ